MKNQYVGDIGDYGKYGLLRFIASRGIKIGVNWYLTENDGSSDGKFTDYLKRTEERIYDEKLFDALQGIAGRTDKNVNMIEQAGLIPGAVFYSEILKSSSLKANEREESRNTWFDNTLKLFEAVDLLFADPDNGISFRKSARTKDSEKFIFPEEIAKYYNTGRNVVFYCHKGRRSQADWDRAKVQIREYIRDAQVLAVTCHRGTQRSYIFVLHPDCLLKYKQILTDFLKAPWGKMLTWEDVEEYSLSTGKHTAVGSGIKLQPLTPRFSVCQVTDYAHIDLTQPFCFAATTDEERSLVCPEALVPDNTTERDDGWRGFRVMGQLDFSLIGILARISTILAENGISIFAISTFNTDYILVKEEKFEQALGVLKEKGYEILNER